MSQAHNDGNERIGKYEKEKEWEGPTIGAFVGGRTRGRKEVTGKSQWELRMGFKRESEQYILKASSSRSVDSNTEKDLYNSEIM